MPCREPSNRERCVTSTSVRQALLVHAKPWFWLVIMTSPCEHLHRVVGAVVTELHLHGARAAGQGQQLVAQADTEQRDVRVEQFADRLDGVVAGLRVAGAVAQEDAVGLIASTSSAGVCAGTTVISAAAIGEHAQDVALDAEVVGDDVPGPPSTQLPAVQG
jgi:hypothetical protein